MRLAASLSVAFLAFLFSSGSSSAGNANFLKFLQGSWSVNCSSPPHLWRIYWSDKAIGPAPALEEVKNTIVSGSRVVVTYSDGYSDEYEMLNDNELKYIRQYNSAGDVYRDWEAYGNIIMRRCASSVNYYENVPSYYQGGWSVDCSKPMDRWRVYQSNLAGGPGDQSYRIIKTATSGPVFIIYYADGDGEVFIDIDGAKLRYAYDFGKKGQITKNYTKNGIVLNRCGAKPSISNATGERIARPRISDEMQEKLAKCVAGNIMSGVAKSFIPSLGSSPEVSAATDTFVSMLLNNGKVTAEDYAKSLAFSRLEKHFEDKDNNLAAFGVKAASFAECALN